MSDERFLSILSGAIYIAGYVPYIRAIIKGKAMPSKASWLIWAVLDSIICVALFAKNALNGQMIGAVVGSWIVVALALKHGTPKWTMLDVFCLGGAALGICLWKILNSPVLALLVSLVVSLIGSLPTFVSAWQDPSREDRTAWTLYWLSCMCAILAIPTWTVMNAAQPLVFTVIECTMMYFLWIRPRNSQAPFELTQLQIPRPPRVPQRIIFCQQCHELFLDGDAQTLAEHRCPPEYRSDTMH